MSQIHWFTGDKGGVGKSFLCRTATQFYLDHQKSFVLVECDRSNPDLLRIYGKTTKSSIAVFSEGSQYEDAANNIFNMALSKTVLVNMPAQIYPAFSKWVFDNEIFDLCQEDDIKLINWFVSDGGYDSFSLLEKYLKAFGEQIPHILVKNWGRCQDWSGLEENESLQGLIEEYQVQLLDFPAFVGTSTRNFIDSESLTWSKAREDESLGAIGRQRVKKFLRQAYAAFETVEVFANAK